MQQVDSRIIDRNGFNGIKTGVPVREGGAGLWMANQIKQMDGDSYIVSWFNAAVANLANRDIRIVTAAVRRVMFNIEAQSDRVRMRIYENPTFLVGALGTLLVAAPPDFGADQVANFAWDTPTVTNIGTLRFDGFIQTVTDYIYTFQTSAVPTSASYLVRLTNMSGAANDISINLETFV